MLIALHVHRVTLALHISAAECPMVVLGYVMAAMVSAVMPMMATTMLAYVKP
jgi:hypothetical protein